MALGRPNKPLFELLREESATGRRPAAPLGGSPAGPSAGSSAGSTGGSSSAEGGSRGEHRAEARAGSTVEPKIDAMSERSTAARAPREAEARREAQREARAEGRSEMLADSSDPHAASWGTWSGSWSAGSVTVSKLALAAAVAVVLVLVFSLYAVGYSSGRKFGQREMAGVNPGPVISEPNLTGDRKLTADLKQELDPRLGGGPLALSKIASPPEKPITKNSTAPVVKPKSVPGAADDESKPVILSTGAVDADPRKDGLNYLVLATMMPRAEARELVKFLSSYGFEAVAVAGEVDQAKRPGNNQDLFKVVALTGVTKEQYKANDPIRQTLIGESQRVGSLWKKTKPGRSDLSKTYWESFVGEKNEKR